MAKETTREAFDDRCRAYKLLFGSPAGAEVLADLAVFCRANASTFHPDPRLHAVAEGRREVFLRIQNHLRLQTEDIFTLLGGQMPTTLMENDNG